MAKERWLPAGGDRLTYNSWKSMRQRCYNPKFTGYHNYGGRGIQVCARWYNSYYAFAFDMGLRPGKPYTIDRIDNDGDYKPKNCRWATQTEQSRNARHNIYVTYEGKQRLLIELCEEKGIPMSRVRHSLKSGHSIERSLDGKNYRETLLTFRGRTQNQKAWAKELGITQTTLESRLAKLGWSLEKALTTGRQPRTKLTEEDAREIVAKYALGAKQTDLAIEYGVSQTAINYLVNGKTWKHLNDRPRPEVRSGERPIQG